jgi:DNA-binding MarR family transcriptional regulator
MSEHRPDLYDLIDRICRLAAVPGWEDGLSPAEASVLRFLSHANRFSRRPVDISDYLALTRLTVNRTLKALVKKGLIALAPADWDPKTQVANLTDEGAALARHEPLVPIAAETLSPVESALMIEGLTKTLRAVIMRRGHRSFGMCVTCKHHEQRSAGGWCTLVKVELSQRDAEQVCREHEAA